MRAFSFIPQVVLFGSPIATMRRPRMRKQQAPTWRERHAVKNLFLHSNRLARILEHPELEVE